MNSQLGQHVVYVPLGAATTSTLLAVKQVDPETEADAPKMKLLLNSGETETIARPLTSVEAWVSGLANLPEQAVVQCAVVYMVYESPEWPMGANLVLLLPLG